MAGVKEIKLTRDAGVFDAWLAEQDADVKQVVGAHLMALMDTRKGMGEKMAKELLLQVYSLVKISDRVSDVWRCKHDGCGAELGKILRNKQGRVTWLRVGRSRMSQGWLDCPKCGRSTFWFSPEMKRMGECNSVRVTNRVSGD